MKNQVINFNNLLQKLLNQLPGIALFELEKSYSSSDFRKKIDYFLLTPLNLRLAIINKNREQLVKKDLINVDYLLVNNCLKNEYQKYDNVVFYSSLNEILSLIFKLDKIKLNQFSNSPPPFCTIIISTYNSKELLELTLTAYTLQNYRNFEIIIADDGSDDGTEEMIKKFKNFFPLQYCWQEDKGFRKAKILNQALKKARGEYIIMTDHDAIPGPDFVRQHINESKENLVLLGGRKCIPEENQSKLSKKRILTNIASIEELAPLRWKYQDKLPQISSLHNPWFYAIGVNISLHKKHFLEVGGYKDSLVGYGDEDIDLAKRLYERGMNFKGILNSSLYHVEHPLRRNFYYIVRKNNILQIRIKQVIENRNFTHKKCVVVWSCDYWQFDSIHATELYFHEPTVSFYGTIVLPEPTDKFLFKIQIITSENEVIWNDNEGRGWSWKLTDDYVYYQMPNSVEKRNDCGDDTIYIPPEKYQKPIAEQDLIKVKKSKQNLNLKLREIDRINVGCGKDIIADWLNIGLFSEANFPYGKLVEKNGGLVLNYDITTGLPCPSESINYIYGSHFIEHLEFEIALDFLKLCYDLLLEKGVIRLTFPDLELWIRKYINDDTEFFRSYYTLTKEFNSLPELRTKGEIFMSQLQNWGHKWAYDFESIKDLLQRAGFVEIKKKEIFNSLIPDIKQVEPDSERRRLETAYVEARKN